jgi:RNA polymerase sigma-70 factor, ECF subfamily
MTSQLAFAKLETPDLCTMMEADIPRLRRYARALTRDACAADDLVQETLTCGLIKQHLWVNGTNLRAWLFTIMHNQYVNIVRRAVREGTAVEISEIEPSVSRAPSQLKSLELRDLDLALAQLPREQRAVILLVGLEGMRYDAVAEITGVPVGTVRSRLSRGRQALRRLMDVKPETQGEAVIVRSRSTRSPNLP